MLVLEVTSRERGVTPRVRRAVREAGSRAVA